MKKNELYGSCTWESLRKFIRVMKLSVCIILFSVFQLFAGNGFAQQQRLTLNFESSKVVDVLSHIEKESDYAFLYNVDLVDVERLVDLKLTEVPIGKVLNDLFEGSGVKYQIMDNQVIILSPGESLSQQSSIDVSGKVVDSSGQPLPGVSIVIKGTTIGTVTDFEGNFNLANVPADASLVFSFVGMRSLEVEVAGQSTFSIALEEDAVGIEEVVAIGYGTQKKVNLTGAISTVTSETLQNRPISSTAQGLQGLIPNLNISFSDGEPGVDNADFNIRGFESINGGNPLILVDGVPMNIQAINPNDIESVTVLKDAAASAIYGARAAFGVILVTTKVGEKTDKINVQYSYELSLSNPIINTELVDNTYDYAVSKNEAHIRGEGAPYLSDDVMAGIKAYYEDPINNPEWEIDANGVLNFYGYTDWYDVLIKQYSPQHKHNLSLSGRSNKANYYVSFGYMDQSGFYKLGNDNYKRYNILSKVSFDVADWVSFDQKIAFNGKRTDKVHEYTNFLNWNFLAKAGPNEPVTFPGPDEFVGGADYADHEGAYFETMAGYLAGGGRNILVNSDFWTTTGLNIKPIKHLNIRGEFSYNIFNSRNAVNVTNISFKNIDLLSTQVYTFGQSGASRIENVSRYNQYYVFNTYAEYERTDITDHYIKALVGFNQEWSSNYSLTGQARDVITSSLPELSLTLGERTASNTNEHLALRGVFYRLNYIYREKYLLEANGRYDGTSRFPKDDRFGFFPSVSVGWRVSKEPFMNSLAFLDNLKLRASYGTLGNQLLDSMYPYISSMSVGTTNYQLGPAKTRPYVSPGGLVSPTLTWETVSTKDVGFDINIFDQKLEIIYDYYVRDTKDMLMNVNYPDVLGTDAPDMNAADLRTRGWELSLTWRDKINDKLRYDLNFVLSDWVAEITKYENPSNSINEYYVGQKLGQIWGFETVGIFQTDEAAASAPDQTSIGPNWEAGDIQYADLDGDGKINYGMNTLDDTGDRKIIGNSNPRYSFGLNGNLHYKDWSLGIFLQGIGKRDYNVGGGTHGWFWPAKNGNVQKAFIEDTWTPDNPDAYFFANSSQSEKNWIPQTRFLQDASYIRLKNISLAYNWNKGLIKKLGLSRCQFYVSGQNLWEFTNIRKPLDPETITNSLVVYPFSRTYSFGVNVSY